MDSSSRLRSGPELRTDVTAQREPLPVDHLPLLLPAHTGLPTFWVGSFAAPILCTAAFNHLPQL